MYFIFRVLTFLPIQFQIAIGSFVGFLYFLFAVKRKKIIQTNLKLCFPEKSEKEIKKITFLNCINSGIGIFEIAMTFWLSDKRVKKISKITGIENIENAKKDGKSIIFLPAHFTPMLLAGRILNQIEPLSIIFYPQNNKSFLNQMKKYFVLHGFESIENRDLKKIIQTLNSKKSIWLPCDQNYDSKTFAPFFNHNTSTVTTPAKLAKNRNVSCLPVSYFRDGLTYKLVINKELENYPKNSDEENATIYNQMLEKMILKNTNQYLWSHRKFKNHPSGIQVY